MKFIVGIDEVGRGPLAGPVAVCAVCLNTKNNDKRNIYDISYISKMKKFFRGARDSKKLSARKREEIFQKIKEAQRQDILRYIVRYESNEVIDKKGINFAIKSCIRKCLTGLKLNPKKTEIFLDGGLKAPKEFIYQKTIIRGDDKKLVISLASIVAKVSRDALMTKMAKKFPEYGFENHKGYGTQSHIRAIRKNGLSQIHRGTFCQDVDVIM